MTTERPRAERRLLRRSTDDRVIGGVAGGLGDYLNVDPLLIRIGFVGLMVFGGLGLILYLAGWILIPEQSGDDSIGGQLLDRSGLTTRKFLVGGLLVVAAFIVIFGILPDVYRDDSEWMVLFVAVVIIVLGGVMLGRSDTDGAALTPPSEGETPPSEAVARPAARQRVARVRQPRSPLAGYVVGATLAAVGLLAIAANLSSADVQPGQYFGLALGAIGLGLVVGAWWGRARVLILVGLVLLPFALAASLITVPLEGGVGSHRISPAAADELQAQYRLAAGDLWLDLTELEPSSEPIEITASVAMGWLVVYVPEDASVEVDAAIGGGDLLILDRWQGGTHMRDHQVIEGDGQAFILDLEAGVGGVHVQTVPRDVEAELGS